VEHGRAGGDSLGIGVGIEELNVLFWEADADFHTSMLPLVVLAADTLAFALSTGVHTDSKLIVGAVVNTGKDSVSSPIFVYIFCFDAAGKYLNGGPASSDGNAVLAPVAVASYSSRPSGACPTFLVGSFAL
jgi:hypothetical protein